jgi:hypothetical protein
MVSLVRITITTSTRNYISVSVPGNGRTDNDYDVGSVFNQLQSTNFPSFTGTEAEWQVILNTSEEVKIENLGASPPASPASPPSK